MTEKLEIKNCPLCKFNHSYKLKVERTYVMKSIAFDLNHDVEKPRPRSFTRIFICPNKNDMFQASFTLFETSDDSINSVKVENVDESK
jgi:hypothetical protein